MKRTLKIIAVVSLVIAVLSSNAFAVFTDMPDGEAGIVVEKAVENGLLTGFEDSTFRPNDPITRAQMATILVRVFEPRATADISGYADVTPSDWYYDAMAKSVAMRAFQGSYNLLNPNSNITREEAVVVLGRVFDLPDVQTDVLLNIEDAETISEWAKMDVSSMVAGNYIESIGKFRPREPMSRLEFATIMDKLVKIYITEDGEYGASDFTGGNALIKANNVSLKGAVSTDTIFIGDGVETEISFEDCDLERVIVRGGKCSVYSGSYGNFRAIGKNTKILLHGNPMELVKIYEDGTTGVFHGEPGYGNVTIMQYIEVEIKE